MNLVFYDLETSGLEDHHEIIQFAGIGTHFKDGKFNILEKLELKLFFHKDEADMEALDINSFDYATWKEHGIQPKAGIQQISKLMNKYKDVKRSSTRTGKSFYCTRTAGHNILGFDSPFLRKEFDKYKEFPVMDYQQELDTLQLASWKLLGKDKQPEDFKLATLCEWFGIEIENAHDALSDIEANIKLAEVLLNE